MSSRFGLGGNLGAALHSRFPFQFAAYGLAAVVLVLDPDILRRVFRKPIVCWSFCLLLLLTWSMLVRTFNPPVGYTNYDFARYFALRINAIGFLLTCVIIFDDRYILRLTKQAVVIATLLGVALNMFDVVRPGTFSNIAGRAVGLYVQPNMSGMALVFGGLIGVSAIRRLWMREAFLLCALAGLAATFSREAMLTFVILPVGAALAGVLLFRWLAIAALAGLALCAALNVANSIGDSHLLNEDTWSRLTLRWSDDSAGARLELAEKTLEQFEAAPLIGQGFGTAIFWTSNSSHNAYLGFMADCGILGYLVPADVQHSSRRLEVLRFRIDIPALGFFLPRRFSERRKLRINRRSLMIHARTSHQRRKALKPSKRVRGARSYKDLG